MSRHEEVGRNRGGVFLHMRRSFFLLLLSAFIHVHNGKNIPGSVNACIAYQSIVTTLQSISDSTIGTKARALFALKHGREQAFSCRARDDLGRCLLRVYLICCRDYGESMFFFGPFSMISMRS